MASDKNEIGLTPANDAVIDQMLETGYFSKQIEAAKVAFSYALSSDVPLGTVTGTGTKWHTGSLDPKGEMARTIQAVFPDVETPYRAVEYFINKGLELLGEHIRQRGGLDMLALIEFCRQ